MRSRHHIPLPRERNVVLRRRPPGSNYFGDLHGVFVDGRDKGEIREKKNETAVGDPKKNTDVGVVVGNKTKAYTQIWNGTITSLALIFCKSVYIRI